MSKRRTKRTEDRAKEYARLILFKGYKNIDAWKAITPAWESVGIVEGGDNDEKLVNQRRHRAAYAFASLPTVQKVVAEMRDQATLADLDSHQKYHLDTMRREEEAFAAGNLTAASQYHRLRGQSGGFVKETVVQHHTSDAKTALDDLRKALPPDLRALLDEDAPEKGKLN